MNSITEKEKKLNQTLEKLKSLEFQSEKNNIIHIKDKKKFKKRTFKKKKFYKKAK